MGDDHAAMNGRIRAILLIAAFAATLPLPLYVLALLVSGEFVEPFVGVIGALTSICTAVGAVIVWRRPGNRVGILLVTGSLLLTVAAASWPWLFSNATLPTDPFGRLIAWWSPIGVLPAAFVLFPTTVLVFPDGHMPGPSWRSLYAATAATLGVGVVFQTIAPWPFDPAKGYLRNPFAFPGVGEEVRAAGEGLAIIAVLVGFVLALASIVYRFRRSRGVERAQVKWLAAAMALNCILFPASYATSLQPDALLDVLSVVAAAMIPVAIGIAVLRYRLYEIDRIISRSVSWAIVSATVVASFALLVIGFQAALDRVVGGGSTLAVALSTLVVAALFQPVRRRIQTGVDRRFDRARYDARRTADAFAERLRHTTDLDTLTAELGATVGRTVRPTTTSIWIPERSHR